MSSSAERAARSDEALERTLLLRDIACIVENASKTGETIRAGYHACMLAIAYPDANFSVGRIIDEIVIAASRAGVPVEMARPR